MSFSGPVKTSLRLLVSAGLLAWLLWRSDPAVVLAALAAIPPGVWLTAFCLHFTAQLLSAVRWRILAQVMGFGANLAEVVKIYFIGAFFNLFLPTAIGGDVLKALYLAGGPGRRLAAGYSVFVDRYLGLLAALVISCAAFVLEPTVLPWQAAALAWAGAGAMIILPLLLPRMAVPLGRWLRDRNRERFAGWLETASFLWRMPGVLLKTAALSLLLQFLGIVAVWTISRGMGLELELRFYMAMYPLVTLSTVLPVSISGLGVREGGFVFFMGLEHVPASQAMTVSLGIFAVQTAFCLLGGMVYVLSEPHNFRGRRDGRSG